MKVRTWYTFFCASVASMAFQAMVVHADSPELDAATAAALDAAIAGEHRSAENKARDVYRRPKESLAFFGFRTDMAVVEIWPGGGWYTEILAPALNEKAD